jgi:hypothetical protein
MRTLIVVLLLCGCAAPRRYDPCAENEDYSWRRAMVMFQTSELIPGSHTCKKEK